MRLLLAGLVLAISMLGCASGSVVMHGDEAFTAYERADIIIANEFMADHIGIIPVDIVWDAPHVALGESCTSRYQIIRGGTTLIDGGIWRPHQKCMYIDPHGAEFRGRAAHEFGHYYGLGHIPTYEQGIMNMYVSPMTWSANDELWCHNWLVCQ